MQKYLFDFPSGKEDISSKFLCGSSKVENFTLLQ